MSELYADEIAQVNSLTGSTLNKSQENMFIHMRKSSRPFVVAVDNIITLLLKVPMWVVQEGIRCLTDILELCKSPMPVSLMRNEQYSVRKEK